MYQVLARKWRPRNFDELVGQEHVARTLRNSIAANRMAHAYIFAGLRGTGKTTVARIFAKCLNCEQGPTPTPCGECAPCREITDGRSMDVMEMDAASRTGVDDIRELQEVVAYAPARDRFKVLIIDEAHMLSRSAANALLKTLEEPPPRVVFILATTEVQKLLPTILSRCQIHEFRRVAPREVAAHLKRVCEAESVSASDAVLDRIARAGEGSVRDSLTLLERVVAFAGTTVGEEDALYVLGAVRAERLTGFLEALAGRDAPGMLTVLDALVGEGHDLLHVWNELVAALRDLLLVRVVPGRADLLSRSPEEAARLEAAAAPLSREDLTRAFQILADLEFGLKGSAQPQFLFEAAIIRLADLGAVRPIEQLLASLGGPGAPRVAPPPAAPPAQKKTLPAADPVGFPTASPAPARTPPTRSVAPPEVPAPARADAGPVDASPVVRLFDFRARLHQARPMTDAMLDAAAIDWAGDEIRIVFPPDSEAVARQIGRKESIELLESIAFEVAGARVRVTVSSNPAARPTPATVQRRADAGGALAEGPEPPDPAMPADAAAGDRDELLKGATREPGIAKLLKEFGANVVDIRPLAPPLMDAPGPAEASEETE